MTGYRVLDIETVPDYRHWTPPPAKWRPVPQMSLPASVNQLDYPLPGTFFWESDEPFPPAHAHRVVAMAWVDLSGDDGKWYSFESSTALCRWSHGADADDVEREMLLRFKEAQEKDLATLVTWNGRSFDLPVISMRSFYHRIPCSWYYGERDVRYRYTEAGHCDLMDVFSDHGASRNMKLGDVARLVGLPGKVGEVSGSSVGLLHAAGDDAAAMEKVKIYCLSDAMQTAVLFARSREHKGMIDVDYYDRVVAPSFSDALASALGAIQ